jgi:hypothetical protein
VTGQPSRIGYQRTAAYILSLPWNGNIVSRLTVNAAMPGQNALGYNVCDERARLNLKRYLRTIDSRDGYIAKGSRFIRVLEPEALRAYALRELPFEPVLPDDFLDMNRTVGIIRQRCSFESNPAIRRILHAEVELLESLRWVVNYSPASTHRDQPRQGHRVDFQM